jgi:23S rRNA (uracil1939-C5)-methyltransferase
MLDETAPTPLPRVGDTVAGDIVDLAYGGAGVLRHRGWVVLVRRAFPGDHVRVRIRRRRKGLGEGELIEIVTPSPERVPPACPHADLCGGCALQGLAPAAQTRWKAHQARELLRRIGRIEPDEFAPPWSGTPWFYRNKMEFTFARRPWITREELARGEPLPPGPALGLHPEGRFQAVFDLTDCRLQSPLSNRIVAEVRRIARARCLTAYDCRTDEGLLRHLIVRQPATGADCLAVLVARAHDPVLGEIARELLACVPELTGVVASINVRRAMIAQGDYEVPLAGSSHWHEALAGLRFRIGAASFFQTQTAGAEALIDEVLSVGDLRGRERVLDLYCGAGTFSLPLARRAAQVLGVEVLEAAASEARDNARANGIANVEFLCGPVEAKSPQPWEAQTWDLVLVDPPRSGLHPRAVEKLRTLAPARILYVSCNPATLARDAGLLVHEGGYRARRVRVFDLFPQTPHLESVLLLERGPLPAQ